MAKSFDSKHRSSSLSVTRMEIDGSINYNVKGGKECDQSRFLLQHEKLVNRILQGFLIISKEE